MLGGGAEDGVVPWVFLNPAGAGAGRSRSLPVFSSTARTVTRISQLSKETAQELQLLQTHAEAAASKESLWAQEVFADASFYQASLDRCDCRRGMLCSRIENWSTCSRKP